MSVVVTVDDGVARVEVPDYSPLSTHDAAFARQLRDTVVDLCDRDDVKVVVLAASGRDFAPPGSPAAQSPQAVVTTWHRDFAAATAIYQVLCFAKKVIVTEVAGDCNGAGSMLVLCSDLTFASDAATFGSPFTELPEANFVLAALTVRLNRAKAWMIADEVITAERAEDIGLINRAVPAPLLRDTTEDWVRSVNSMPLDGVTMSKMLLQAVLDGHGVGREFDLADHYAMHLWAGRTPTGGPQS